MPGSRLLVSVRDAAEAAAALAGGADLIDVKEPTRGSLGQADADVIAAIVRIVGERAPVSAAMGELRDCPSGGEVDLPAGVRYFKWGLCGLARIDWRVRLLAVQKWAGRRLVAVAYADGPAADAPSPAEVIAFAADAHFSSVLIDTFCKDGSNLLDVLSFREIEGLVRACHEAGLRIALAGSLNTLMIGRLCRLRPDWLAVRSAACDGGRTGVVSEHRVRELAGLVHSSACRGLRPSFPSPLWGRVRVGDSLADPPP